MTQDDFDSGFYQRFYRDPRTRVTTPAEMARRAAVVAAILKQWQLPVRRILDAGCGLGWMRPAMLNAFPRSAYVGLEFSEHLCRRYGWVEGSLTDYRARARFDLVICHDVMQYLPERDARRAMANLGRLCRGALYFYAPTVEDWRHHADRSCSDTSIHLRESQWYRSRLSRHFRYAGFGIHVRRGVSFPQWELERPRE
ncbi:hypothetical protein ACG33_14325 [Steroidobacter denitrificans]|uniref:Methyltransferase type 12 domain-containing protein n=1 Tax=Steroidobacter denitrificans TaxID=465721 RepID=A0A127FCZ0_STEDE|nr:class I SAM-dependent methyltransferase [Steroidobacter denitrificans]AMN48252.1 hypothetical protein ACG33_14325 [Steroidobacter denitrificans]